MISITTTLHFIILLHLLHFYYIYYIYIILFIITTILHYVFSGITNGDD